jgi:formate dehydrogenase iron-sulfur subunit/NADH-quinone oxidoreductase subunit F
VIAFSDDTSAGELLYEIMHFAAFESCGKCAPCRLGTQELESMLSKGYLTKEEAVEAVRIAMTMSVASLCGHGQAAGQAFLNIAKKLWGELVR